jgi:hypothetical protein
MARPCRGIGGGRWVLQRQHSNAVVSLLAEALLGLRETHQFVLYPNGKAREIAVERDVDNIDDQVRYAIRQ